VLEERPYLGEERDNGYLDYLEGYYGSIYKKYDIPENCDEVSYGAYDDRILLTVCTIFIYPPSFTHLIDIDFIRTNIWIMREKGPSKKTLRM